MKRIIKNDHIKKYAKSLQFRIFLVFILVGIIPIMLVKQGILVSYEEQAISQRGTMVQNQCRLIAGQLGSASYIGGK